MGFNHHDGFIDVVKRNKPAKSWPLRRTKQNQAMLASIIETCKLNKVEPHAYTFAKAGILYFSRRVPNDLRRYYKTGRIAYSLRTKSIREARSRAMSDAAKPDHYWYVMRYSADVLPGKHLLAGDREPQPETSISEDYSFKAAVAVYLKLKSGNHPATFETTVRRSCGYLVDCCEMKCLTEYVRSDAPRFRDYLFAKGS